ncbi:inner-membrane translocator [Nitratireductor indicus C115]|uniref:Inner-membrane translocator n=1 Tax=Nitratireductor indicus C115 TaxID=1231190 RepID=K2NK64_9HYPH|nr:branched-chain amino acid ABC transporter permease [Nitratireductor indicus]EKF39840.1 inner-membrane translocator [Nitratireductor indicus C115]SFQ82278.1 branched-chain amino acid transport system permease protein [Nitratireductor indicus]
MDILLSQVANGLVLGFIYVLIAVGLSITFGMLGIVNFAHGAFFALGAYFSYELVRLFGWPAAILAPFLVAGVGMVVEVVLIRKLYGKEPLLGLVVTFALGLLIEAVIRHFWGTDGKPLTPPQFLNGFVEIGPIFMTNYRVAVLVATVAVLVALWAFLNFTPYGRIIRAGSRDPEMVDMLGINLPRVFTGVFGLGCAIAAIAGILAGPLWTVSPSMAANAIMPAFVIVAIGGLGSFAGALIAGLTVGIVTAMTIQFWPEASTAAMYVLMLVVLLLRPRGLLGSQWERFE